MADLTVKVCFSLLLLLQAYPAEVVGWARTQAFKSEQECVSYYANMTFQEGSWCTTMWDGLLCWPPSPVAAVALLPCPPPQARNGRTKTAQKRCNAEEQWEDIEDPSSSDPLVGPSHQTQHPCLTQDENQEQVPNNVGAITAYRVNSRIEQRYAQTTVTATVMNVDTRPSDLQFKMRLPKTAFISSLVMEIDGANYTSSVRRKSVASRSYQIAKKEAKDAALLEQSDMQEFEVSANIVSRQVTFYIKYEELLRRINGQYVQKIYIRPGTRIPEAEVTILITEQEPIKGDYHILELPGQEHLGNRGATVSEEFTPDGEIRVRYKHIDPPHGVATGVDGTFTIAYTLANHIDGGTIQRVGSYFSHFLSLDTSERFPKMATHTVFALDVSNSMGGGKLIQMKEALKAIIKTMTDSDSFEVLAFSSDVASLGVFNGTHYRKALRRVHKLQPMSYSNLNQAYLQALTSAENYVGITPIAKQIVMISDGEPTQGIIDPSAIRRNVIEANQNRLPIFGIGFGAEAHFNLMKQISADSQAYARHLHVKKNLARDLKAFYKEISKPILTNLTFTYPENEVDPASVVKITNTNFYSGGEVVAAGKVYPGVRNIHPWVMGVGQIGTRQLQVDRTDNLDVPQTSQREEDSVVARLWAYLTIQDLLKQAEMNDNYPQVKRLVDQATQLALQFRFVTHVTSLVVRDATGEYEADFLERESIHLPQPHSPSSTSSHHRGPSDLLADAPQPPRKQRYQPYMQGTDMDLNFIVYSPNMNMPLCFNYHARDGAYINIIRDLTSGIIVNGETTSSVENPKLTFITKLFLGLGKVNITLTPDHMEVDCINDNGNMEVDRVTKSLWPFYKKNGKKYKKRMANGNSRTKASHRRIPSSGHRSRDRVRDQQVLPSDTKLRTHEYHPYPQARGHDTPASREEGASLPEEGRQPKEIHYVMNSVADDYLPHHNLEPSADRSGLSGNDVHRQSQSSRPVRRTQQKDHGLCNFNSRWEDGVGKKYGDVMIVLNKKRNMHIRIGDGDAHFVIVRSQKGSQRFLGFYLENEKIMSSEAHGLIGQFTSKNITTSLPSPSSPPSDNSTVELLVKRRNRRGRYRTSRVSGFYSSPRSQLADEFLKCIQMRRQGKGLLDGRHDDYLLSCLQC